MPFADRPRIRSSDFLNDHVQQTLGSDHLCVLAPKARSNLITSRQRLDHGQLVTGSARLAYSNGPEEGSKWNVPVTRTSRNYDDDLEHRTKIGITVVTRSVDLFGTYLRTDRRSRYLLPLMACQPRAGHRSTRLAYQHGSRLSTYLKSFRAATT